MIRHSLPVRDSPAAQWHLPRRGAVAHGHPHPLRAGPLEQAAQESFPHRGFKQTFKQG